MSILSLSGGDFVPHSRLLFATPAPAGRQITAGFTYIQRIGKAASYDVWFPDDLRRAIEAKIAAGQKTSDEDFPAEWAAVRQIELLQESGNYKIYDLDPADIKRSTRDLSRSMQAGGYRVTIATIGRYQSRARDELEILDQNLQQRIAQMIHMLYLDEASAEANSHAAGDLAQRKWDYRDALPHVGMVLGAQNLFWRASPAVDDEDDAATAQRKKKQGEGDARRMKTHRHARHFFDMLSLLPQNHIVHDTAIGLQLPELNGENEWNYIAASDETLGAFIRSLNDLFDPFNHISLSRLHEREGAGAEVKASTLHMRSYGHPLNDSDQGFYRRAALYLG